MKRIYYGIIIAGTAILTACSGNVKENLGLQRNSPDEFRVISKPPLSIPPNFNLRPPHEGASPLGASTAREEARDALLSNEGKNDSSSSNKAENLLLRKAGTKSADSNIKSILYEEQRKQAPEKQKQGFFKRLFSKKETPASDPIVNAKKESNRIRKHIKDKKPVTGSGTPTVEHSKQGILQRIFSRDNE